MTTLTIQTPTIFSCPWGVLHLGHVAWYQRAALVGDFRPGLQPRPEYVVYSDERVPDLREPPRCMGCGRVPRTEDLVLVERATRRADFLDIYRRGRRLWPAPTNPATCAWCNAPGRLAIDGDVKLCPACESVLRKRN